ncbi:MAG: PadR family transcriptional regulator [Ilumatobacteraceae bacterium]
MARSRTDDLLLGEWACLAILVHGRAHGYDVSLQLAKGSSIGRVWTLSRPLTYRSLDQLTQRGLITPVREERGRAGGNRTILAPTTQGRARLRRWLRQPVEHLRDVRSELLVKLILCELVGADSRPLLEAQRALFAPMAAGLTTSPAETVVDPVAAWRDESSRAVLRFLDRMLASPPQ